ncbi:MAG: hypothetical protein PSX42_23460 [bacterium]|nr:hypothetical protein [bacterium]
MINLKKPNHRMFRPVSGRWANAGYSSWAYIVDRDYSLNPEHYTRAFSIIQQDIFKLFEFIEPADINCDTYSFRIHELFMRICMEVESNFKAILKENIFNPTYKNGIKSGHIRQENEWNINDFKLINKSHLLGQYKMTIPIWKGSRNIRRPFEAWNESNTNLTWYQNYNSSKHDRVGNFHKANFDNLIDAYCGLCSILSSQFRTKDFMPGQKNLQVNTDCYYGGGFGLGNFLIVDFPDWNESELYDFEWSSIQKNFTGLDRFQKFDYNSI